MMVFKEEQRIVSGSVPEFGAIFMSSGATKKECFNRKLLGLPSGLANFVKQVKAGMILFLFEFEKRELHGVFQASSDGAMNIVPHAYISSGKQFPAQVKFNPFWCCSPLCENEFCDAIKENYFSKYKFNFGLSEDQVYKLLYLFGLRRLNVQPRQTHFTRCKVPSYSTSKFSRAADDGRSMMNNQLEEKYNAKYHHGSVIYDEYLVDSLVSGGRTGSGRTVTVAGEGGEYKVDDRYGKVISKDYFEESLHKVGGVTNGGKSATTEGGGNEHNMDIDLRTVICSFDNEVSRVPDDVRFAKIDRLGVEDNGDNGYRAAMYPSSFQPTGNMAAYTHNSAILQSDSHVHNQLRSSSNLRCSMGPQISNLSGSTSCGDANVTSTCPYNPDAPGIDYRLLSFSEVSHSFNPVPDNDPSHNSNAGNIFPSVRNQSLLSYIEPVSTRRSSDVDSGFVYRIPMPSSEKHHEYSSRIGRPFFGTAYSETVGKDFFKNEDLMGVSLLEPSSTRPFLECGNSDAMNEGPSCSGSPRYPFFVFEHGSRLTSQEKHDHEASAANVPMLKQGHSQSHGLVDLVESESIGHHDSFSLKPDVYRSPRNMYYDSQKKRPSVFSRLGTASKSIMEENVVLDDDNGAMDASADEIMSMLHQSRYQWVKMRNNAQSIKDNGKNVRKKRQTTFNFELLTVKKISKGIIMNDAAETEDNGEQCAATSFVDFKRRSEVRKIHGDNTKISVGNGNAEKDESGGLRKRRKLIRPNFNENKLPDVKSIDSSIKVEPHLLYQISHEDNHIEGERVSNCRGEEMVETCGAPFRNVVDESGEELSQNFVIKIMQPSVSPEEKSSIAEEALMMKNSVVDIVSQDLKNGNQSTGLESPLETHDKNAKRIAASEMVDGPYQDFNNNQSIGQDSSLEECKVDADVIISSEIECHRDNEKPDNFHKVYPLDGDKLEKAVEDLLVSVSKSCEMDFRGNVQN